MTPWFGGVVFCSGQLAGQLAGRRRPLLAVLISRCMCCDLSQFLKHGTATPRVTVACRMRWAHVQGMCRGPAGKLRLQPPVPRARGGRERHARTRPRGQRAAALRVRLPACRAALA